tara:strand:+ start:1817 stop:2527 length:711 start_codon:yes stop_codon:yes gene_type:complete
MPEPLYTELNMRVVAHRGYASKYPENTITALDEAVKVGVEMVEFDVQLTKDGVPIMIHDGNFKRTTGLDLSVFELNKKDFHNHIDLKAVSSVEEVMVWLKGNPRVKAFVEIKQESILFHGLEKCMKALKDACETALAQCVLISFNPYAVEEAIKTGFHQIGWVVISYDVAGEKMARKINPNYLFADTEILPEGTGKLWEGRWEWVIYEVVSNEVARKLHPRGVDIIETKEVEKMLS